MSAPSAAPAEEAAGAERLSLAGESYSLEPGTYVFTEFGVPLQITVPEGWEYNPGGWFLSTPETFVKLATAATVPVDACAWSTPLSEVGPSVADLAGAMAATTSTTTTEPTEIEIDGYSGLQFDVAVEEGVVIEDCRDSHICIHSEYRGDCTRFYHEGVGERETYRIVDLDGERALLAVGQWDGQADADEWQEAQAVFHSIRFAAE
ncbi:hypothetical protein ACH3VR_11340 [Microbacterium sp. B2969]|uniref:DUF4241 domain-containing protein n=1 Tax=Microbacterium alkaliflavum TaxID=3248839 RepID=A0ABW7Q8H5_9MICO